MERTRTPGQRTRGPGRLGMCRVELSSCKSVVSVPDALFGVHVQPALLWLEALGGQPVLGTLSARAAAVTVSRCPAVRPNPGTFPDDGHHTETVTQLPEASNVRPALSPQTRKILPEKAAGSKIFFVCGLGIPFPSKSN